MIEATLSDDARNMLFLVAAWMANVDGEEQDAEVDALCQLRRALELEPPVARELLQMARSGWENPFEIRPRVRSDEAQQEVPDVPSTIPRLLQAPEFSAGVIGVPGRVTRRM